MCAHLTLETAAVGAALPGLLRHWFDEGYRRLAGWHRERVESGPKLPPEAIRKSIPCGPPGAAWAFVGVDRRTGGRLKSSARVYRESTMRWFLGELADPPFCAQLGTAILDDRGYPDEHPIRFELYRTRVLYEMDWCRLTCTAPARALADRAAERAWLEFLRTAADMANPSFGHFDYLYEGAGKTPTEGTVGPPWLIDYEADSTSRQFLRGYGWLTVLAQELADRLGGAEALRRTGAFHEVEPLAAGGVWCLATERFRDFDEEALLRVFLAIAPVLRPGTPRTWPLRGDFPPRIVYRDAADPVNPTPPEPVSIAVPVDRLVPGWAKGKTLLPPAPN